MGMVGRPRAFDRGEALDAAMRLFWRKGFAATSMADLCEAMNIRSPSLYAAFGDKEALYLEAFERYAETIGPPIWGQLEQGCAQEGVRELLFAAAEALPCSEAAPGGCMTMLAGVGDAWPDAVSAYAREMRADLLAQIRARLARAVGEGELPASTDLDRLSRFFLGAFQGMAIQARDGATAEDLRGVAEAAMRAWP